MTATTTGGATPDSRSDAAIAGAVAEQLARHRARVVQLICGPGPDWVANLRQTLRHLNPDQVVLVLAGAPELPAEFAALRTIRAELAAPQRWFGAVDLAVALDRLPRLEGTLVFVLLPTQAAALCGEIAEMLPARPAFAPWLARFAAAQRDAACGGGAAG